MNQKVLRGIPLSAAAKISPTKLGEDYFLEPYKYLVVDNFLDKSLARSYLSNSWT
jgi:hypothetical protein